MRHVMRRFKQRSEARIDQNGGGQADPRGQQAKKQPLTNNLDHNVRMLQECYSQCADAVFRRFKIGGTLSAVLLYLDGFVDKEQIGEFVLAPLMQSSLSISDGIPSLIEAMLPVTEVKLLTTLAECDEHILQGKPVLLIEGERQAVSLGVTKLEKRNIEEPQAESIVRGPREGFTETLSVNLTLIRRKIRSSKLKMHALHLGDYTNTEVILSYIEGIADPKLVEEVKSRINRIKIDSVLETSYIEELIEDQPYSPFPQSLATERPDVAAAYLLEGRIVLIVAGTPFVLIVPITLFALLQSPGDYYDRYLYSTPIRWLRYVFLGISMLLPSLYVAILSYHQEMLPAALYFSIASSREGIPFPAIVEALIMEIAFEALREAGVRLPKQVGSAVSIVGALVIGQAAVAAGIVSSPMVMVVALTGIASFMVPYYAIGFSFRLLRFPIMLLAGMLGLLGVIMGIIAIAIHLCSLRSFGVPYMAPLAPVVSKDMKDVLVRAPWWRMLTRPRIAGRMNEYREAANLKPSRKKPE
ncbi:spore germination protein [Paenibacillus spongiae]|uniref:Spore germination protein n=1 Tax=Paenibacillus spongiae TaxID=2909671 RepID=A0ABY5S516_9BACL|nr:spore germination protein [Paenibacillus spongiae]UVI28754.1 spore germination protein [Paenibacillus spongiae]